LLFLVTVNPFDERVVFAVLCIVFKFGSHDTTVEINRGTRVKKKRQKILMGSCGLVCLIMLECT
jgi:hypothetical protein